MDKIGMEDAVRSALRNFQRLYQPDEARDPLLEAIELSDDGTTWDVTIGFNTIESVPPSAADTLLAEIQGIRPATLPDKKKVARRYKLIQINAEDGSFRAMKIKDSW